MDWLLYAVALPVALVVVGSAGCAIHWAIKHGQTQALWSTLRSWLGLANDPAEATPLLRSSPSGTSRQN